MPDLPRPHPRWRLLGAFALAVCAGSLGALVWKAWSGMSWSVPTAVCGFVAGALGLAAADFVSGVFHFLADRFGHERVPVLGPNVIAPFRLHHEDPKAMTRHGVAETNGDNALIQLPLVLPLAVFAAPAQGSTTRFFVLAAAVAFFGGVLVTNQIHKWAHATAVPRWVHWTQRRQLILSPVAHARHHRSHDRAYCITTGWCNALLDRFGVLTAIDRAMRSIVPSTWIEPSEP
jgi:ubiquitin-conjugating enzyme E2 variant